MHSTRSRQAWTRRHFLQSAGVLMALPGLEAFRSVSRGAADSASSEVPRRMVCIETNMGILPQYFFPQQSGRDYTASPYLARLQEHRADMTVFSGVSLPGVDGAHSAEKCFLTGTPHPGQGGFRNGISLDQVAAEQIGNRSRYPSLVLSVTSEAGRTLSFTRSGAPIPSQNSPKKLFEQLFLQGKPDEVANAVRGLKEGRSLLDFVGEQSKQLSRSVSKADAQQLDQYFSAVRELEKRLHSAQEWETRPKPTVTAKAPDDINDAKEFVRRTGLIFDVITLALQTDSTRVVSLFIDTVVIHNITHHGNRPDVLDELRAHEEKQFDIFNAFLNGLAAVKEGGARLLDRTMVLYGTCMGSANSHSNMNLPVLLAGGGFKHGQHLAFDTKNNYPLSNLYVSMLQRLGIEANEFSTGKGTMRGLEQQGS